MYALAEPQYMTIGEVLERASYLRNLADITDRERIRAVMNGGAKGVQAVINSAAMSQQLSLPSGFGIDLPTANIMYSGSERLAQRIGRQPIIKTDMIPTKDSTPARKRSEKRARIVSAWDDQDVMELQYPQIGRWLPGYGFTLHVIRERWFGDTPYPVAQLRDPFDVYPGTFGANQQPEEVAVYRRVPLKALMKMYPQHAAQMASVIEASKPRSNTTFGAAAQGQWESGTATQQVSENMTVVEYMCDDGTYVVCTDLELMLGFIPNPLMSGPSFVVTKRFAFDKLQGQWHHNFGLMAMMAKLNILGLIGVEDATFRETNITGEMIGNVYKRGRFAVNEFEAGARIEKPTSDQLQQTWQAINILERQFRIVAGYDVAQDGQSPNSFATGQGIKELGSSADMNVREYQTSIKHSIEALDRKRLEWDEVMHPHQKKRVYWYEGSKENEESYIPSKDIAGDYRCVAPSSLILTSDLRWVRADLLSEGDELIGFDAELNHGKGKVTPFKASVVEHAGRASLPSLRIVTDKGTTIVSSDHPFVLNKATAPPQTRQWLKACDARVGDKVLWMIEPWEELNNRDAGYVAGIFDGEGSVDPTSLSFAQVPGTVLDDTTMMMKQAGFDVAHYANGKGVIVAKVLGGKYDRMRFLGQFRPSRLLAKSRSIWEGKGFTQKGGEGAEILSIEDLGSQEVVTLQTSCRTFIADGFAGHNTKRVYGAMATFDENSKIITGLQLLQARVMDRRTLQENLDGIENISLINERIDQDQAREMLIQSLGQRAAQGDATADMALVEILSNPADATKTLTKLFTPQEPQMSPEEQMMAQGMGQPGMPGMGGGMPPGGGEGLEGGPPPAVQTIMAMMESEGGGAMSMGRL